MTKLYDELDFQRACQAYIWGLPIVGFAEWQQSVAKSLSVGNLDYVRYLSVRDKLGILTPNDTTPYILGFPNLAETGALVVEVPAGPSGGGVLDFWQRPITDTGFPGPDKGEGGNYLISAARFSGHPSRRLPCLPLADVQYHGRNPRTPS